MCTINKCSDWCLINTLTIAIPSLQNATVISVSLKQQGTSTHFDVSILYNPASFCTTTQFSRLPLPLSGSPAVTNSSWDCCFSRAGIAHLVILRTKQLTENEHYSTPRRPRNGDCSTLQLDTIVNNLSTNTHVSSWWCSWACHRGFQTFLLSQYLWCLRVLGVA